MIDDAAFLALRRLRKSRWPCRLFPATAEIGRAEDRRSEVAGLGGRQNRPTVARIQHEMADDVAKEMRAVDPPFPPCRIAVKQPSPLAGGDHHQHTLWRHGTLCPGACCARPGRWLLGRRFLGDACHQLLPNCAATES